KKRIKPLLSFISCYPALGGAAAGRFLATLDQSQLVEQPQRPGRLLLRAVVAEVLRDGRAGESVLPCPPECLQQLVGDGVTERIPEHVGRRARGIVPQGQRRLEV